MFWRACKENKISRGSSLGSGSSLRGWLQANRDYMVAGEDGNQLEGPRWMEDAMQFHVRRQIKFGISGCAVSLDVHWCPPKRLALYTDQKRCLEDDGFCMVVHALGGPPQMVVRGRRKDGQARWEHHGVSVGNSMRDILRCQAAARPKLWALRA